MTYTRMSDARTAINEFDGANAKGQPIRLTLISTGDRGRRDRNPFDSVQRSKGSLLDRVERPRNARSLSPDARSESPDGGSHRRRGRRGGAARNRRSDVSKPAPDHIDRYVPGQRSSSPRRAANGGRRQGGGASRDNRGSDGRRTVNGRPRKTQEELDQEMDDYWGAGNTGEANQPAASEAPAPAPAAAAPAAPAPAGGDDDIDMIE